jgi:hypothetical protein
MEYFTNWLFFNLLFGAIPYALTVALNRLQFPDAPLLHPSSEVLFLAVVATSSALGNVREGQDGASYGHRRSPGRVLGELILMTGVLISSLLYGAYVYHSLTSPGREYGIDCTAVGALDSEWRLLCAPWMRTQGGFFRWSLWVTALWVVVSTFAVYSNRPRARW